MSELRDFWASVGKWWFIAYILATSIAIHAGAATFGIDIPGGVSFLIGCALGGAWMIARS